MTCHAVQLQLSLYLYGELDFATEEALERHLESCAFCRQALSREKTWHTAATSEQRDVPLELLAQCRQNLRSAIAPHRIAPAPRWKLHWPAALRITPHRWSYQLAIASLLVFLGFSAGRLADRFGSQPLFDGNAAGLFGGSTRIRDIQPNGSGRVRIVLDQVSQREVIGSPEDGDVRRWLLVAIQDPSDAGIRVDSVEMLSRENGADVRDALLNRVQHDPNAAVRLKALDSVRRFAGEPAARSVIRYVLEHDTDPAVRSEAIDVLAPANEKSLLSPELTATLQNLARSEQDEYVRGRVLQLLRTAGSSSDIY